PPAGPARAALDPPARPGAHRRPPAHRRPEAHRRPAANRRTSRRPGPDPARAATGERPAMSERRLSYRFGPLERRGLFGAVNGGQVFVIAAGALVSIAILDRAPSAPGALAGTL